MNSKISERLKTIYDQLIPNSDVWDFCCDHGYLGAAAYKSKNFKNIYFVDQVPTIIEKLKNRFQKYVYDQSYQNEAVFICEDAKSLKLKNTLKITGNLCIAGVGGLTIIEILESLNKNNVLDADRVILGPHRDGDKVLIFLAGIKSLQLANKIEVIEKSRIRNILVFNRVTHVG